MTHKSIKLPEKIYEKLRVLKRDDESIPDFITRLMKTQTKSKKITFIEEKEFSKELEKNLEKYKEDIIGLPDNWNGQGSKGFTEELWERIIEFLRNIIYSLKKEMVEVPVPLILPNSDGSFDIDWETDEFELLVNIPTDHSELIHLYGEKLESPEDEIDVRINHKLAELVVIEWLKKIH